MRIGIGLPTTIARSPARLTLEWARLADAGPFASLAAHDRLAYDSLEPVTALAAAAAVTQRLHLASLVMIGPLRGRGVMLAKQVRTLAALAGAGRLTLGLGLGPRRDDYDACGVPFERRSRLFDEQLADLTPLIDEGIELLIGGGSRAALARMVRVADGLCHSGGPPRGFRAAADRARIAWSDAGRPGKPRLWGLGYFALGPDAAPAGRQALQDYYSFAGGFAARIASGLLTSADAIAAYCAGYEQAGCDDLVLFPTVAGLAQVERLGNALQGLL
jgi:alkanesulfonate monooxygenase SsuD/methylene tetrahydromethanopterin reductase-like flavin-dependent oxidoreductase (luciferase family)